MIEIEKAGLYFHIPFCRSKCPYCDFFSVKYDRALAEKYIDRLIEEIEKYNGEFDTIYFGGGTPSVIDSALIGKVIEACKNHFTISDNCEITVECNPSSVTQKDLEAYSCFGVNRISLGMQSARNTERTALGRVCTKDDIEKAVIYAKKAKITNISLDLMLATPKQTVESLDESFDFIKKAGVTHISAYMLKIEEGTKFYALRDRLSLPDEEEVCLMYLKTIDCLKALGFEQYEISNFSKPGFESRHNLKYWTLAPYLGIGATAHSFWQGRRFYYDRDMNIVDDGRGGGNDEKIMLGLRLNKGIEKNLIKKDIRPYLKAGLMKTDNSRLCLTPRGMLVSNTILSNLI